MLTLNCLLLLTFNCVCYFRRSNLSISQRANPDVQAHPGRWKHSVSSGKKLPQNLMGFCWIENKRNLHWNVAYYLNSLLPCGPTESFPLLNLVNLCFSLWNNEKPDKLSGLAIFTVNSEPPVLLIFELSTLDNLPVSKGLNPTVFLSIPGHQVGTIFKDSPSTKRKVTKHFGCQCHLPPWSVGHLRPKS